METANKARRGCWFLQTFGERKIKRARIALANKAHGAAGTCTAGIIAFIITPTLTVVATTSVPSKGTEAGLTPQVTFAGTLPQERLIVNLLPSTGVTDNVAVPDLPGVRFRVVGETLRVKSRALNVAVTDSAAFKTTVQIAVPEHGPLQPMKLDPEAALAVRVITVPLEKLAEQVAPQFIPAG